MSSVLRISEAASLALHTAALLANETDRPLSAREIADVFQVSEAHLAKVLQRLARVGIVVSTRGPHGGFVLRRNHDDIALLEVYEAIEGPLASHTCLLPSTVCGGEKCILGGLLSHVNKEVKDYLTETKLRDIAPLYRELYRSHVHA